MKIQRFLPGPGGLVLLIMALAVSARAAEYYVGHGGDVQITATPPAAIQGSAPNTTWDMAAGAGYLDVHHSFASCCNGQVRPHASFRCDDLVFSSPGGQGGTATVTVNLFIDASVAGCTATTMTVGISLGTHQSLGTWDGGEEGCHSGQSSGAFTGMYGTDLQGTFTSAPFVVPLDTPLVFEVSMGTRIGSYQVLGAIDAYLALGGLDVVFNVVDGPEDLTANSVEAGIVDNMWADPALSPVPSFEGERGIVVSAAPNPFNPLTTISFAGLPEADTRVEIYDLRGGRVATLFEGPATGGIQTVDWNAAGRPSGIYLVAVRSGVRATTEKVALLK